MSDPKASRFWRVTGLVLLYLMSAVVIFNYLFIVPKFEQIFADALPGKPLPMITQIIISYKYALAFAALALPLACTLLFKKQKSYAILLINVSTLLSFLENGIVIIALFMPMVSTTTGISAVH